MTPNQSYLVRFINDLKVPRKRLPAFRQWWAEKGNDLYAQLKLAGLDYEAVKAKIEARSRRVRNG
jgi:hypothetical protein